MTGPCSKSYQMPVVGDFTTNSHEIPKEDVSQDQSEPSTLDPSKVQNLLNTSEFSRAPERAQMPLATQDFSSQNHGRDNFKEKSSENSSEKRALSKDSSSRRAFLNTQSSFSSSYSSAEARRGIPSSIPLNKEPIQRSSEESGLEEFPGSILTTPAQPISVLQPQDQIATQNPSSSENASDPSKGAQRQIDEDQLIRSIQCVSIGNEEGSAFKALKKNSSSGGNFSSIPDFARNQNMGRVSKGKRNQKKDKTKEHLTPTYLSYVSLMEKKPEDTSSSSFQESSSSSIPADFSEKNKPSLPEIDNASSSKGEEGLFSALVPRETKGEDPIDFAKLSGKFDTDYSFLKENLDSLSQDDQIAQITLLGGLIAVMEKSHEMSPSQNSKVALDTAQEELSALVEIFENRLSKSKSQITQDDLDRLNSLGSTPKNSTFKTDKGREFYYPKVSMAELLSFFGNWASQLDFAGVHVDFRKDEIYGKTAKGAIFSAIFFKESEPSISRFLMNKIGPIHRKESPILARIFSETKSLFDDEYKNLLKSKAAEWGYTRYRIGKVNEEFFKGESYKSKFKNYILLFYEEKQDQ